MYRFVGERYETGIFVGLNAKSEQYQWMRKQGGEQEEPCPGDVSGEVNRKRKRCKEDVSEDVDTTRNRCKQDPYE